MAILIKNMEMPRRCVGCCFMKIVNNAYVMCSFYPFQGDIAMTDERPDWCPLVELPENHGRLIDGTELAKILETAIMTMKTMARVIDAENDPEIKMEIKAYCDILNGVKDMEAVIEAEGNDG